MDESDAYLDKTPCLYRDTGVIYCSMHLMQTPMNLRALRDSIEMSRQRGLPRFRHAIRCMTIFYPEVRMQIEHTEQM